MSNDSQAGKKCPNCGAEGRAWRGEHETAVRNIEVGRVNGIKRNVVDVGWRCWSCGYEWGFELAKEAKMAEPKVECASCGEEPTEILGTHTYSIKYDEEQGKWVKETGEAVYGCGLCLGELDTRDIEDILRQVDEL